MYFLAFCAGLFFFYISGAMFELNSEYGIDTGWSLLAYFLATYAVRWRIYHRHKIAATTKMKTLLNKYEKLQNSLSKGRRSVQKGADGAAAFGAGAGKIYSVLIDDTTGKIVEAVLKSIFEGVSYMGKTDEQIKLEESIAKCNQSMKTQKLYFVLYAFSTAVICLVVWLTQVAD
jgi:hypothetical protein